MVPPNKQEDNQDQESNQRGGNQGNTGTDRRKRPSRFRFILYVGIWMFLYYLYFLVRVRPRVFSDYAAWVVVSLVLGCVTMLGEFVGTKLLGLFGRDDGKGSDK